jgi:hypothetical protein
MSDYEVALSEYDRELLIDIRDAVCSMKEILVSMHSHLEAQRKLEERLLLAMTGEETKVVT